MWWVRKKQKKIFLKFLSSYCFFHWWSNMLSWETRCLVFFVQATKLTRQNCFEHCFWSGETLQGCKIARMVFESHFLANSSLLDTKDVVESSKKSAVSWTFERIFTVTRAIPQKLTPVLSFPHVPQQLLKQHFSKFQPPSGGLPCQWWVLSGKFGVPICPNFPQYTPL